MQTSLRDVGDVPQGGQRLARGTVPEVYLDLMLRLAAAMGATVHGGQNRATRSEECLDDTARVFEFLLAFFLGQDELQVEKAACPWPTHALAGAGYRHVPALFARGKVSARNLPSAEMARASSSAFRATGSSSLPVKSCQRRTA